MPFQLGKKIWPSIFFYPTLHLKQGLSDVDGQDISTSIRRITKNKDTISALLLTCSKFVLNFYYCGMKYHTSCYYVLIYNMFLVFFCKPRCLYELFKFILKPPHTCANWGGRRLTNWTNKEDYTCSAKANCSLGQ